MVGETVGEVLSELSGGLSAAWVSTLFCFLPFFPLPSASFRFATWLLSTALYTHTALHQDKLSGGLSAAPCCSPPEARNLLPPSPVH